MAPFFVASYRLHLQRQAIETVVAAANLVDRDPISVALIERGEVTTPTEKFASTRLRAMGEELFDRQGKYWMYPLSLMCCLRLNFPHGPQSSWWNDPSRHLL